MRDIDKVKEKVQKLLNLAADRAGTPEGDSFYEKAFALMAAYGFDERDLAAPDEGDEVAHKHYEFAGAYSDMQSRLLLAIAQALHCTGYYQGVPQSTRVDSADIFGLRRHMERVDLLYSMLLPAMMAGARNVEPDGWASAVVRRRSFMRGFAATVADRLERAERTVSPAGSGYELALVDDSLEAERARNAYAEAQGLYFKAGTTRRSRVFDADAYYRGQDAGSMTDLGQTRVQSRPALPF